jgi:hypothetical protein
MGEAMVWLGAAVTLAGVGGLVACMLHVWRLRQAGLPDADLRAALGRAVTWNMIALFVAVLGLMVVIMGIAFR